MSKKKKQALNPNKTRPWSGPYAAYKRTRGKARNATQTPLAYPSCTPLHCFLFLALTTLDSGQVHKEVACKSCQVEKKSAKMTATAANRNKRQQKLRQNSCAVAFFFWQQLQQQPQSQSQVRFQFRFQWLNLLLSLETGNWLQDKQQQLGEAEAAQTEADGNMWQAWRGNNII